MAGFLFCQMEECAMPTAKSNPKSKKRSTKSSPASNEPSMHNRFQNLLMALKCDHPGQGHGIPDADRACD